MDQDFQEPNTLKKLHQWASPCNHYSPYDSESIKVFQFRLEHREGNSYDQQWESQIVRHEEGFMVAESFGEIMNKDSITISKSKSSNIPPSRKNIQKILFSAFQNFLLDNSISNREIQKFLKVPPKKQSKQMLEKHINQSKQMRNIWKYFQRNLCYAQYLLKNSRADVKSFLNILKI